MSGAVTAPCDRALASAVPHRDGTPTYPGFVLATTILASSLAFVDGTVVNVGLPAIGRDLGAGAAGLQWAINAYLLPLSALLLAGGAAGDLYGRRRLLVGGVAVFALASALCAAAWNLPVLLAGRILQGVGAAMLMPNSLAILGASFSGAARGQAIGTWAAVGAGAGAIGPLLGGWLIDAYGWRTVFLINLPVAAAAIALALRYVEDSQSEERPPLDLPGIGLATAALAALTWGLTIASGPDAGAAWGFLPVAAGVSAGLAFLWVEARRGEAAMMPLALFGSRPFVGLTLLTLLLYGALGALTVLVPYLLIVQAGYSATGAGAALAPLPLVIAVASPPLGRLAGRVGSRWPLTLGPVVVAAGFGLAARLDPASGYWTGVFPAILLVALGLSGAVAPLTTAVLASVDGRHGGVASGFNSAVARTGGLVATALLGAALSGDAAAIGPAFRAAMWIGAAACLLAGACAWFLLRGPAAAPKPA